MFHSVFNSYNLSFAAAAFGMILAMIIFQFGKKHLVEAQAMTGTIPINGSENCNNNSGHETRQRIFTLITLFAIAVFFWIAFYQNGFALTLFAERSTVISNVLKPETYQFFGPFFILIFTPLLVMTFGLMRNAGKEPSSASKIFTGMFISAFSMLVMVIASLAGGNLDQNIMSPLWLISSYLIVTISEILVSPMGLSFVSKVSPKKMRGLMMGCWFGATAIGSYGSGVLGKFYSKVPHHLFFLLIAMLLFCSSILVLVSLKRLNRFSG
jgi:POT family proton-dependent oligopeptide transporter